VAKARRERKVVTILFADLVGFTSRAEQMDPEDVAAELGPGGAIPPKPQISAQRSEPPPRRRTPA
jgi:hypothetical protein